MPIVALEKNLREQAVGAGEHDLHCGGIDSGGGEYRAQGHAGEDELPCDAVATVHDVGNVVDDDGIELSEVQISDDGATKWSKPRLDEALARLRRAMTSTTVVIEGGACNKSFVLDLLAQPEVALGIIPGGG